MKTNNSAPHRRFVKAGEALALDPKCIHQGPEGSFWVTGASIQENTYDGDVGIVYIRGPLEHHDDEDSDNYDSILDRVEAAFLCEQARTVVLCIDSPGGVVSGLNETVASISRLQAEHGKPLIAFVNEMATSAAYALACSANSIVIPRSGICGSVGVISTMADQVAYDKKAGFRFVTITSGARKADGHPHVEISDGAIAAERRRVDKLAKDFFKIVSKARGIPVADIQALQAGIFLGPDAKRVGLVNAVMGWDALFSQISEPAIGTGSKDKTFSEIGSQDKKALALPNKKESSFTRSSLTHSPDTRVNTDSEEPMGISLATLLKHLESKLVAESDPNKKKNLQASIEAAKKVKHTIEKYEEEESDEEEDEEEEESEAKGNETDRKEESDDGDEDDDDDEDDEDDEEDDEEEAAAKATVAALRHLTGKKSASAILGAVQSAYAKATEFERVSRDVAQLKKKEQSRVLDAMISEGISRGQFRSPSHAKALRKEGMRVVKAYLAATPRGTFLSTPDAQFVAPDGKVKMNREIADSELSGIPVTDDMMKMAKMAAAANPKVSVETLIKDMQKAELTRMNGKGM